MYPPNARINGPTPAYFAGLKALQDWKNATARPKSTKKASAPLSSIKPIAKTASPAMASSQAIIPEQALGLVDFARSTMGDPDITMSDFMPGFNAGMGHARKVENADREMKERLRTAMILGLGNVLGGRGFVDHKVAAAVVGAREGGNAKATADQQDAFDQEARRAARMGGIQTLWGAMRTAAREDAELARKALGFDPKTAIDVILNRTTPNSRDRMAAIQSAAAGFIRTGADPASVAAYLEPLLGMNASMTPEQMTALGSLSGGDNRLGPDLLGGIASRLGAGGHILGMTPDAVSRQTIAQMDNLSEQTVARIKAETDRALAVYKGRVDIQTAQMQALAVARAKTQDIIGQLTLAAQNGGQALQLKLLEISRARAADVQQVERIEGLIEKRSKGERLTKQEENELGLLDSSKGLGPWLSEQRANILATDQALAMGERYLGANQANVLGLGIAGGFLLPSAAAEKVPGPTANERALKSLGIPLPRPTIQNAIGGNR